MRPASGFLWPSALAAPRRLLASAATARRVFGPGRVRRSASQAPPPGRAHRHRGGPGCGDRCLARHRPGAGQRAATGADAVRDRRSRIGSHSLMARIEVAPVSTAQAVSASTYTRPWRTPRGLRGSGTAANRVSSPGSSCAAASGWLRSGSRTGGIREETTAGTDFRRDRWARHPHDLGSSCLSCIQATAGTHRENPLKPRLRRSPGSAGGAGGSGAREAGAHRSDRKFRRTFGNESLTAALRRAHTHQRSAPPRNGHDSIRSHPSTWHVHTRMPGAGK